MTSKVIKRPKGYLKWVKKLKHPSPVHYTMEYAAADGYTGTQLMQYIEYLKSKGKGSCLIGPELVYCLMDRIAVLEEIIHDAQKRNRRG